MKNNLIISTTIGAIVAFLMMYIAWEHIPQCEIHEKGVIDFDYLFTIGSSWFLLAFVVASIIMALYVSELSLTIKKLVIFQ